jgi:glutamate racemase
MRPADRPVGVFDSGLGGLTVLKEIMARLPDENTVYFGDSGRTPYGSKSPETIGKYARQIVRFLQEQQVKMIVIACNTVSACASDIVRESAGVPVVEVISPGAAAATQMTRNGRIGVIGTRNTVASDVYIRAISRVASPGTQIFQQACPMFVSLAEEGWWNTGITRAIAAEYLNPLLQKGIDTLLLGCTHYPLLSEAIGQVAGPDVRLINAGSRVAEQVRKVLIEDDLLNSGEHPARHRFFTSDSVSQFQQMGSAFLEQTIGEVRRIDIEQF